MQLEFNPGKRLGILSSSIIFISLLTHKNKSKISRPTLLCSFVNKNNVGVPTLNQENHRNHVWFIRNTYLKCLFLFLLTVLKTGNLLLGENAVFLCSKSMRSLHHSCWVFLSEYSHSTSSTAEQTKYCYRRQELFPIKTFLIFYN